MKPYKDLKGVQYGIPGGTRGRPKFEGSAKQFGFPISFGHLKPRIFEHTHFNCALYTHPSAPPFFGVTEEGPALDHLLLRIRAVLRLHLVELWKTERAREEIIAEGKRALHHLGEHAEGVQSLVVDIVEQSIQKGGLPPRSRWSDSPTTEEAKPQADTDLAAVFLLNKRLLHEIKELNKKVDGLQNTVNALAGGLASRPQVAQPHQHTAELYGPFTPAPAAQSIPPAASSVDDLLRGGPAPAPAAPTPQTAPQRPAPAPNPAAAAEIGLRDAPALPSTKPQAPEEVHHNKPLDTTRPFDLKGADSIGESLAFDDMMKGR
jgi:hypothetical protein